VRIATGSEGGTFEPLGNQLAEVLKSLDSDAKAVHTDGSLQNLRMLTDKQDDITVAFTCEPALRAFPFSKRGEIRALARLYTDVLHLVVSTDENVNVTSLDQLRGKNINIGLAGSATNIVSRMVLRAANIEENEVVLREMSFRAATDERNRSQAGTVFSKKLIWTHMPVSWQNGGHGTGHHGRNHRTATT
jgi:TRAP transporter TAXI family solute receptor